MFLLQLGIKHVEPVAAVDETPWIFRMVFFVPEVGENQLSYSIWRRK